MVNLYKELRNFSNLNSDSGAIVEFVGKVRKNSNSKTLKGMFIECYKKMAESQIQIIANNAMKKWSLDDYKIVHRYGDLKVGEVIVIVMVSSQHRKDALEATSYIIDWLKIKSPFWKKEIYNDSEKWVEQNNKDLKIISDSTLQRSH